MAVSRLSQTTLQNGFEKYSQVWDGRSAVSSMEAISAVTLSASQIRIEFNNIPQTYSHLQIRGIARTNRSGLDRDVFAMQVNNDTGSNYSFHWINGTGASPSGSGTSGANSIQTLDAITASTAPANTFGALIIDVLDYTNTNKNTTFRLFMGRDVNGSGNISFSSGAWYNTNAISSIVMYPNSGDPFVQYSSFSLYGIK